MAPSPALIERPANLVVQVSRREVDGSGVVRNIPVAGVKIELYGPGEWRIGTTNPMTTDANGRGRWTLTCRAAGTQPLGVVVADTMTFPIDIPNCTAPPPPPPPPTTAPAPPVTPAAPTTTARPPA